MPERFSTGKGHGAVRLDWKAGLGIAVTVLLLWWALHDVSFGAVWSRVREGDLLLLAAAVAVATAGFLVRALRWKVLLHTVQPGTSLHSRFAAVSIGFMANNVLPARVGEFARAYALSRTEPVSASGAFGTLVVERVLDALTLLVLLFVVVSLPDFPASGVLSGGSLGAAVNGVAVLFGVLVAVMTLLLLWPRPFVRLVEKVATVLPPSPARLLVDALEAFLDALAILRHPGLLLAAVAWTVGFWLFNAVSFWLGMMAFGIDLDFVAAIFVQAVVAFGVALPSAPGFVGPFHAAALWSLSTVYGVEEARALAFAFGYHLGGWIPITAMGLGYAWKLGLSLSEVEESEERVEEAVEAEHPVAAEMVAARSGASARAPGTGPEAGTRTGPETGTGRDTGPEVDPGVGGEGAGIRLVAPAKVNLLLRILSREESGYHRLETVFQAVGLTDVVEVRRMPDHDDGIVLHVAGADVGPHEDNLVTKAARAFVESAEVRPAFRIRLEKRIPAGAGLGGGSSDAAATLRALNLLSGEPLSSRGLWKLASTLGSDVPFFLGSGPLAVGHGRGSRLRTLSSLDPAPVILGIPDVHVSTPEAYRDLAAYRAERNIGDRKPELEHVASLDWGTVAEIAENDFEPVVVPAHPAIARVRIAMAGTEPRIVLLSGSGSSVFAVYGSAEERDAAWETLSATVPDARFVKTTTLESFPEPELLSPPA